ncbi:hypothetical protein CASFOL_006811 [Castilleja foliolosa]|uniref:F-box domain-containing protein n=1 Tax=Castilleja foliolosa TaxID=1961234 RepID=A0ABD3E7G7_9LAMI
MVKLLKMNDEAEKPSSAQIVASIDDLLIEIIKRLPLKKIAQLKLVSKYWNSLILDPKLCLLQNQLPSVCLMFERLEEPNSDHPQSYIIFIDKSMSPPARKMIRTIDAWPCQVLHSCNGLLLCVSDRATNVFPKYSVCNLTTSDRATNIFPKYSVSRKVSVLVKPAANFDFEDGVYWNGAINWLNIVTEPRESVYFNLDCDQTLKLFPKPPLQGKLYDRNDYYFGESCDHLHFVDAYRTASEFIVHEMKMDYSEWFVKYKFNGAILPCIRNMIVVRGKIDENSFLVIPIGNRIVRYNFEQKTFETLYDFESTATDRSVIQDSIRPFQYIESICSV